MGVFDKICIVGDLHLSEFSSIIRKKGQRLENCINTLNWVESTAVLEKCTSIIYLGDFFDKSFLNAEELTSLSKISWSNLPHYFLIGNHEIGDASLNCSSTHILNLLPNTKIIDEPTIFSIKEKNLDILLLPYIINKEDRFLNKYVKSKNTLIFSHNDIKGIQMGQFISKEGFDVKDIEENCTYFINGHIHNGNKIGNKILNIGNITGQNFSEDAFQYNHHLSIIDINSNNNIYNIKNPYAFNFYKLDVNKKEDFYLINKNAIMSIKCKQSLKPLLDTYLEALKNNIIEKRIILTPDEKTTLNNLNIDTLLIKDHISQFKKYILDQLGDDDYILKELQEII